MNRDREDRLQEYLDGRMEAAERAAFEQELLADETLFAEAYDEEAVREALAARAHARGVGFRPRPRRSAVAFLGLAAAASIAFLVFVLPGPDHSRVFRGGSQGAPRPVAPVGAVPAVPDRFVWTRDPGAVGYRLEIFRTDDGRVHVATTADTFLATGGALAVPRTGSWRATALDSVGVGVRSTGRVDYHVTE